MSEPAKQILYKGEFLSLVRDGHWEYAERPLTGAVLIVAVTESRNLLLVEQYRIPLHAKTIELPAGVVGDESHNHDEDPAIAAARELTEETGYEAGHLEKLAYGPTSGGLTSEMVTFYRAVGLRRVGRGGGTAQENITVHEVPMDTLATWLRTQSATGLLIDPKIYAALYLIGM